MNIKYFILLFSLALTPYFYGADNTTLGLSIDYPNFTKFKQLFASNKATMNDTIAGRPILYYVTYNLLHTRSNDTQKQKELVKMIQFLIEHNASVDEKFYGQPPLYDAVGSKNYDAVEMLLKHGAQVDARDSNNDTPLINAARRGTPEIIELLLTYEADINAVDDKGNTPLHWAILWSNPEIVDTLLQHGAKTNITNNEGLTAYNLLINEGPDKGIPGNYKKMQDIFHKHSMRSGLKKVSERETVKPSCDVKFTHK